MISYAVPEAPQILDLERKKDKETSNHQIGKRIFKGESLALYIELAATTYRTTKAMIINTTATSRMCLFPFRMQKSMP
jgi:hypothetical protein